MNRLLNRSNKKVKAWRFDEKLLRVAMRIDLCCLKCRYLRVHIWLIKLKTKKYIYIYVKGLRIVSSLTLKLNDDTSLLYSLLISKRFNHILQNILYEDEFLKRVKCQRYISVFQTIFSWELKYKNGVSLFFFFTWRYLKISIPIDSKNNDKLFILCLL